MLTGDPGIGKTHLTEKLAQLAIEQGFEIHFGYSPEERGAPPYWLWVQIIRSYISKRDADTVRSILCTGATEIATVEAQIRELLPDL